MERLQAFKFELSPSGEQRRLMRRFAGYCRFVYNRALAWQVEAYEKDKTTNFRYVRLANMLPQWKEELPWLSEAPSQTLQQSLKNLERAYLNFFEKRAQFPIFKKRGVSDSFRYPQGCKLDQANSRVFLPKLGWVRYRNSREVLGEISNITLSLKAGRWYASIQTSREIGAPVHPAKSAVGIDMGVVRFATLSDGSLFEPLGSFKKHQRRLTHFQRMMARRTKFGRNWHKAKRKVQTIHARIGNCRRDYLHKCSTAISQSHAMVCIEDLQVRNMSKSASGTLESPGTNVRAKSGLNRSILDQGWGEFRRQLEYKLQWKGGILIPVPPHNTSRECPSCGHTHAGNRKTQSRFACVQCGYENHADVVGALNILARGHRVTACRDTSSARGASAQEPTERNQRETLRAASSESPPF